MTDYYVDAATGNDGDDGLSEANAWLTVQQAATNVTAGDTVYIRAGTYSERVVPANSGSAGNYITYINYPGESPVIDATGNVPAWGGAFHISGKDYIRVSGLEIQAGKPGGQSASCLMADGDCDYIIFDNNKLHNASASGVIIGNDNNQIASNATVDNNEIYDTNSGGYGEGLSLIGVDVFEVKNNYVHDLDAAGGPKEGIDVKYGCTNGTVHHNKVHDVGDVGIYCDGYGLTNDNIRIYSNLVYDVATWCYAVAAEQGGDFTNITFDNNIGHSAPRGIAVFNYESGPNTVSIINNTFAGHTAWAGVVYGAEVCPTTLTIRNNIWDAPQDQLLYIDQDWPTYTLTHNLFTLQNEPYGVETIGTDSVEAPVKFLDPGNDDYHLKFDSPAREAGTATDAPATDYDGNPRPLWGADDIGAYEYVAVPGACVS